MATMIGVDIGGTFADFVALDTMTGATTALKVLTTPAEPGRDIGAGLRRLAADGLDLTTIERFVHGTTVGVNTIIQRRGARVALFTTAGFTDMLELARLRMPNPYSLFCERPAPLVPREHVFPIAERMTAEGRSLAEPTEPDVAQAVAAARRAGCEAIVVSFLHAWRRPAHERAVAAMIAERDPSLTVFCGQRRLARNPGIRAHHHSHPERLCPPADRTLSAPGRRRTGSRRNHRTAAAHHQRRRHHDGGGRAPGLCGHVAVRHRVRRGRRWRDRAGGGRANRTDPGHRRHQRGCGIAAGWRAVLRHRACDR